MDAAKVFAHGFSTGEGPSIHASKVSPRVLVIGGGVIGLTTAWLLLDRGLQVTILAKDWASWTDNPRISSQGAGALWKCLPLECGPQAVLDNLTTSQKWTMQSYEVYSAMASVPELRYVVEMRPCTVVTKIPIEDDKFMSQKVGWIQENNLPGFRRGSHLLTEYGVDCSHSGGITDAYEYLAPVINVDNAMGYLMDLVKSKGAILRTAEIKGDLLEAESQLLKEYQAEAIINATGLGAGELAADPNVYGLHGALLRVINDGKEFPIVRNAMVVSSTKTGESGGEGAFLLPRNDGILALGTISSSHGKAENLTIDSSEVQEMRRRCETLLPFLKNARLDGMYPIVTGTRPQRRGGARVAVEKRSKHSRIIHSYGHGGAGWSMAFGSALDAVRLVSEVIPSSVLSHVSAIPGENLEEKMRAITAGYLPVSVA